MDSLLPRGPLPAVTDTEGLIDVDQHLRAALAAWNALSPAQRRAFNREAWLAAQARERRERAERAKAYDARMAAVRRQRTAEAEAEAAAVRARTCPECFLVKTPTGRCDCTEG